MPMARRGLVRGKSGEASGPAARKEPERAAPAALPQEYVSFRSALAIDRDNLDACIMRQAASFHEVFEHHVLSTSTRDEKRDELARRDAEIAREFRRAQATANEKCTDAMTTDAVLLHPDHVKLSDEHARLKTECDLWYSLREAYDQRVRMLHELVALHTSEYYGAASAGGVGREARDEMARKGREAMAAARKQRAES